MSAHTASQPDATNARPPAYPGGPNPGRPGARPRVLAWSGPRTRAPASDYHGRDTAPRSATLRHVPPRRSHGPAPRPAGAGHFPPTAGYDYDTFAADLAALLEHLDLHDAVLAGHSMGTGEVTRYLGRYGSARVAKGVLVSPIPPYLQQADDNPDGVPQALFDGFAAAARADTPAWMKGFLDTFYNIDTLRGTLVSDQAWQASWNLAVTASATAAVACIGTWTTDFRDDLPAIDVPILVIQGDADQVLPLDKTGKRLPGLIKDVQLLIVEGGPHAIAWTHAGQVNTALLDFLRS